MRTSGYFAGPVIFLLAILQTAVLPRFPIYGHVPQAVLIFIVAWGLLRGMNEGVFWAFAAGIILDLFSTGPMGLTSLAMMTAVFVAVWIQHALPSERFFLPLLLAGLASLTFMFVYFLLLRLFGRPAAFESLIAQSPSALLNTAVFLPIYWLNNLFDRLQRPRPIQL